MWFLSNYTTQKHICWAIFCSTMHDVFTFFMFLCSGVPTCTIIHSNVWCRLGLSYIFYFWHSGTLALKFDKNPQNKQVTWLASPRSKAQVHICLPVHSGPLVNVITTLLCCDYFSSSSVVSRAFSALCMYSKFRHHPHHLGYLCAKFCFFCGLQCWASPWRKIAYSITHPAYLMLREPKRLHFKSQNGNYINEHNSVTIHLPLCLLTYTRVHVHRLHVLIQHSLTRWQAVNISA